MARRAQGESDSNPLLSRERRTLSDETRAPQPFGFPFVVALHAGADLGVVLIVSAMDLEWARRGATAGALAVSVTMSAAGAALLWKAWRRERLPPLPLCSDD